MAFLLHKIATVFKIICKNLFFFLPIKKNKIVFINFNGKGYGCNPKYIADEFLRRSKSLDMVWLVNDLDEKINNGIRKVKYGSIASEYELSSAKIIITNVKNEIFVRKKKCQYLVQTWHGSFGFKLVENDAKNCLSESYIRQSMQNSKITDLFLSDSKSMTELYKRSFWCTCDVLESGFPRNDIFFDNLGEINYKVRKNYGVNDKTKILLFAPTFRDNEFNYLSLNFNYLLKVLEKKGDKWIVFVRFHPNIKCNLNNTKKIMNVSNYSDMQELLVASDCLITDYSSCITDFAIMNKPVYIYAPDLEQYKNTRGLEKEYFNIPYKICENTYEIAELMLKDDIFKDGYKRSKEYLSNLKIICDGTASKKVVNYLLKIIKGEPNEEG